MLTPMQQITDLESILGAIYPEHQAHVGTLRDLRREAHEQIDKIACDLFRQELSWVLSLELQEALKIEVKRSYKKLTAIGEINFLNKKIFIYPDYENGDEHPNGYWKMTRFPDLYEEKVLGICLQPELMIQLGQIQAYADSNQERYVSDADDIPFDNSDDDEEF
ncbi:hypothetical protein H6F74_09555 [Trichocoleus sp. FACHB-90]|uniref:hypothetical protein n=1 Tax=Cyanophyceae TaxID=3028117 RepID=UPI001685D19E|nr:hypothetical protein [Trichocoleus sp. FACHB-90]MBD1926487.1 hypothetical protein [Trichocoleus sp. FACHB-90]